MLLGTFTAEENDGNTGFCSAGTARGTGTLIGRATAGRLAMTTYGSIVKGMACLTTGGGTGGWGEGYVEGFG